MENEFGLSTHDVVEVGRTCEDALSSTGVPRDPLCIVDLTHAETAASDATLEHEIIGTGAGDGVG